MERRELPRLVLNNTSVRFKKLNPAAFWTRLSPHFSIHDLSKSGLSFKTDFPVSKGEKVYLKVFFSDGNAITLKGIVKWRKELSNGSNMSLVGVQFLPFGKNSDYNDLSSLNYLRKLLPSTHVGSQISNEFNEHLE
ncbi:type IV pilus assembly PilZ [Caldithrix abyssi DSM 13497]|uniref:PilZ domain-containing protein n=1 Tax=Caldithrix abyssi DSM 13497 TaxID=880073 RepID=H1XVQ9_CALAY|nr:PilZ domain-containing protein [Caldithrix abyssi]APF20904.1 PilZ domain-containing protein [Caldithrix abyssi DSM 13497]EHO40636.1 type IV pilus assembly PilZ [Caldithrix abyssi DSM 13497]